MEQPIPAVRTGLADAADHERIDAYVRGHAEGTPFHLTAWNEAVARGCRQKSHYLIAESAGRIVGVLPLGEVHSPLFGRALVSSPFAVGGGILADDDRTLARLAEEAWILAVRLSCPSVELRGGMLPADWPASESTYAGFVRPLAADDEAELLAIPRKQRAEVRKALGLDLDVEVGTGTADRAAHYGVYAESVRNLGTPVFPRSLFDAVLDGFGADADILTVRKDGQPLASVLSLYHGGAVMPYWGGGTRAARTFRANDMMYYALMNHARRRGCTHFDFGRSKFGTGAFAFKRNWGFEPAPLRYAVKAAEGEGPREINPMSPKYRMQVALWQKLPLWLANRLGPAISRGLG
nr:FemAB family XrtA/PEP-CTERM system-associated protein [Sphingomonas formosensis]